MFTGRVLSGGIDPKGDTAPRTMAEAVDKLFKVKDGRLEHLSAAERTKLAERIHFVATGQKKEPCYLVVDKSEGQTPASFNDTFLSLTKQNKDDISFVQVASTMAAPAFFLSAVNINTSSLFRVVTITPEEAAVGARAMLDRVSGDPANAAIAYHAPLARFDEILATCGAKTARPDRT